jgi:hypothetical protein
MSKNNSHEPRRKVHATWNSTLELKRKAEVKIPEFSPLLFFLIP